MVSGGITWINADAVEEARQMGARWVRVIGWGGEGRGAFGILEHLNWNLYDFGDDTLSELRVAIVVNDVQDLGREPHIDGGCGGRRYIGRYQYSGTVYYLRDDDDPGLDRHMPAGAVPIDEILSLPNRVMVSGLAHHSKDEVNAQR